MTDINELTAKAASAIGILENIAGYEPEDIDGDTVELRFENEAGCDTGCDVSIVEQCQNAADVIMALTEALEAAEKQRDSWRTLAKQNIAEREKDIAALDESRQRIADLESKLAQSESWAVSAQNYIAELEARTLTVKLPHWSGYTCSGEGAMLDACVRSLESQGFTVQIEGE